MNGTIKHHLEKTDNTQTIKGNQTGTHHVLSGSLVTYQRGEAVVEVIRCPNPKCRRRILDDEGTETEWTVLAGLCGICLYYLLENIALTYTWASNVGVIISVAPFFTAMLSRLFLKSEGKLRANFFIGFVVAMAGVALISFNGSRMELNPAGDVLAVAGLFLSEYNGKDRM